MFGECLLISSTLISFNFQKKISIYIINTPSYSANLLRGTRLEAMESSSIKQVKVKGVIHTRLVEGYPIISKMLVQVACSEIGIALLKEGIFKRGPATRNANRPVSSRLPYL